MKNEYFFHNTIPNKILIKHPFDNIISNEENMEKDLTTNFYWSEINTEGDVKSLLNSLSEKGVREQNLSNKIKKLLNKKLKIINNNNAIENKSEEEILKNLLSNKKNSSYEQNNRNESRMLSEIFESLDQQVSDYLHQDNKEWEEFITRADLKAFVNASDNEKEIAKCLILLNDRFKNPYKINEFKNNNNRIISDEEEYGKGGYVDSDMKIDLGYYDENKVLASKSNTFN